MPLIIRGIFIRAVGFGFGKLLHQATIIYMH
jgi:hypothetical protein